MRGGGASDAVADIHRQLVTRVDARLLTAHGEVGFTPSPRLRGSHIGGPLNAVGDVALRRVTAPRDAFLWGRGTPFRRVIDNHLAWADVVQVYWTDRMLGVRGLADLVASGKAVVVVPVDFEPLTGGCHYPYASCTQYTESCSDCPISDSPRLKEAARRSRSIKRAVLGSSNVSVVAGNGWYRDRVVAAGTSPDRVHVVFPQLASSYHAATTGRLRPRLGIDGSCSVLIAGATMLSSPRKRVGEAVTIAAQVMEQDVAAHLVIVGDGSIDIPRALAGRVHRLGLLDSAELADALADSDVFVSPSVDDAGPLMVAASWAAGTPVAAYRVGYAADLLRQPECGIFLESGSTADNAIRLGEFLTGVRARREFVRDTCRALARVFRSDIAGDAYANVLRLTASMAAQSCAANLGDTPANAHPPTAVTENR
jgi:glycosyltransferase involved in cell wall biosynthesis